MTELKPCPWCRIVPSTEYHAGLDNFRIACTAVECEVNPHGLFHKTEQEAIEAWNRRYDDR